MMWMPLRAPKMKLFIFGFQRLVWCPKWTPASIISRMVIGASLGEGCALSGGGLEPPGGSPEPEDAVVGSVVVSIFSFALLSSARVSGDRNPPPRRARTVVSTGV